MNGVSIELNNQKLNQPIVIRENELFYNAVKRLFDIIVSIIALVILSPMLIIIAIMIKLDSKGKVIFKQERIGKNGRPIYIYKFRTMIPDAEEVLKKLLKEDSKIRKEYSINKKISNDPRVTKIGKLLRRTSLDEVPQFLNILLGDMSFVGPRPYLYREIKDMGKYYQNIVKMTPGLTGLWQVSGRNNIEFKNRCVLDNKYHEIRGFKTDLMIIVKTFEVVIFGRGAK